MTLRRSRESRTGRASAADLSYFASERPVGLLLSHLAAIYERAFLQGLSSDPAFAITSAEHAILRCVAERSSTATEIARTLGLSKQAIGKTVTALERRGYVTRSTSAVDERAQEVSMTEEGRRLVRRSIRVAKSLDARTRKVLGAPDFATLKSLLVRTLEADVRHGRMP